jgi:hypothetical protein
MNPLLSPVIVSFPKNYRWHTRPKNGPILFHRAENKYFPKKIIIWNNV